MRHYHNTVFLLLYLTNISTCSITITVEDGEQTNTNQTRHLHQIRHSRGSKTAHPYISASSAVINPRNSNRLESFSLNCPHVADASNKDVRIEVIWTLNETIWLKIEDGQRKIVNGESTFNKRRVAGKTVMRILLNNARYLFDYDELTGDFSLEISPVLLSSDIGSWQCHVTVWQPNGNTHTLTSRRKIKANGIESQSINDNTHPKDAKDTKKKEINEEQLGKENDISFEHQPNNIEKRGDRSSPNNQYTNFASFSRQNDETVYITRKSEEDSSVVFDRNDPEIRGKSSHKKENYNRMNLERESIRRMDTQIDYELDMNDDFGYSYPNFINSRSRIRSAQYYNSSRTTSYNLSYLFISLFSLVLIQYF